MESTIIDAIKENKPKKVIQLSKKNFDTLPPAIQYMVALCHIKCNQYKKALNILVPLKKHHKNLQNYFCYLGLAYVNLKKFNQAKTALDKETSPSLLHSELIIKLAIDMKNNKKANQWLTKAKKLGHTSTTLKKCHVMLLMNKNQFTEAETILTSLFKQTKTDSFINKNLLKILEKNHTNLKQLEWLYKKILNETPKDFKILFNLLLAYNKHCEFNKLASIKKQIQKLKTPYGNLQLLITTPPFYYSIDDINKEFKHILTKLKSKKIKDINKFPYLITPPFFLTYTHYSVRPIMELIYQHFKNKIILPPPIIKQRKKKHIAVISSFFSTHSVMHFYLETIINLPKDYHVTIITFNLNNKDKTSNKIKKRANSILYIDGPVKTMAKKIHDMAFDMIIYPEIGMNPFTYNLAMIRLAPLQVVLIGHPVTSGMSSIDYYISWKQFHHKHAQSEYTETLVQLNNMPMCYHLPKINTVKKSKKDLNLPTENHILFYIPMVLQKIHPNFDKVIKGITSANKNHIMLFIQYQNIEHHLLKRFKQTLSPQEIRRIKFIKPFVQIDYYQALTHMNVVLETFPFGGGNTVLQSFAAGTPVITMKGKLLKNNFGSGYYSAIGSSQFVANTVDEYIDIAIKTANDPSAKSSFKSLIKKNKSTLFDNMAGNYEFYDWIKGKI